MPASPFPLPDTLECDRLHWVANRDGQRLAVRDDGPVEASAQAPAILCLSGLTRNGKDFQALVERLKDRRRIIRPDYRGRGLSDYADRAEAYTAEANLDDVRQIIAALGLHRVVVVGTSLGGLLAMGLGASQPTTLAGAVLNDVGPVIETGGLSQIIGYIEKDRPVTDWPDAVAALRAMIPDLGLRTPGDWEAVARNTYRRGADGRLHFDWDVRLVEPLKRMGALPDLWPLFGTLRRLPVLAVRGGNSPLLSPHTLAAMARAHPGLETLTVDGAGHTPTLAEEEVVPVLDRFLMGIA